MLLSHTSGFPNWRRFTPDQKLHINFEPGSRYAYSGEGIALLQRAVESATKKSLEDLMQEKAFKPLNMTRASMTWHLNYEENHAEGYDENGKSLGPQRRLIADAAGSMKTTPRDFALFLQAVASGQLLREDSLNLMLTPQVHIKSKHQFPTLAPETTDRNDAIGLSYGLGWGLYFTSQGRPRRRLAQLLRLFPQRQNRSGHHDQQLQWRKHLRRIVAKTPEKYLHAARMGRIYAVRRQKLSDGLPLKSDGNSGARGGSRTPQGGLILRKFRTPDMVSREGVRFLPPDERA
jgi:CubicO group peptidase (beta-lactamase class C family)